MPPLPLILKSSLAERVEEPHVGPGHPFPLFPLFLSLPHLLLFFYFSLFPFLICVVCFLILSIHSLSTRIVPLCFQAGGHSKRPNLGLVFCVYFMLSVLLSYDACLFFVVFGYV